MRTLIVLALVVLPVGVLRAQPVLVEPPEFPPSSPGPSAVHPGAECFLLASGVITPGDVDWVQVTIPIATAQTIVDVDFPEGPGSSRVLAWIQGGAIISNNDDNNRAADDICGLGSASEPVGSIMDSVVDFNGTPRDTVMDIVITGGEDSGLTGAHSQEFAYNLWVYVLPEPCTSDTDCADGIGCTTDSCDLASGFCANTPDDALCDNSIFCDGLETCDPASDCQAGSAPSCDDGVGCTVDGCDAATDACRNAQDDSICDNGVFCDGSEICNATSDCQAGLAPSCDDGVGCTVDGCDAATDACLNGIDDSICDNGVFCDGLETCDPVNDCETGPDPCPDQLCVEDGGTCVDCLGDADCDDTLICNAADTCDANGVCQPGVPSCPPDQVCNPGTGLCEGGEGRLTLDLKPGACPNRLMANGRGFFPAALVASEGFDAALIDVGTVRLARSDGESRGRRVAKHRRVVADSRPQARGGAFR